MKEKLRIILILIFLGIFIFSTYQVINYVIEANKNKSENNKLVEKAITIVEEGEQIDDERVAPFSVDFNALQEENKDIVGWIYSKDTPINYPVLQSDNNDYYLRRLITGEYNTAGSLFMDYKNKSNLEDNKTIIYGHNMKNATMFGTLPKYRNQEYFDQHKNMYYFTAEATYLVKIFSAFTVSTESNIYTDAKFTQNSINEIIKISNITSNVEVSESDKIMILSTCAYDYEDARYVVFGKLDKIS